MAAAPLATIGDLQKRLGRPYADQAETDLAAAALADASALVRAYGCPWPDPATAPDVAVSITLAAAERRVRNPEGMRMEMEGSYSYQLGWAASSGVVLTEGEIKLLARVSGQNWLVSVRVRRPVRLTDTWYAPVVDGSEPIPWSSDGDPGGPR